MSVFTRRFLSDPGNEVLLEIESVNVLDLDPPASITGIGTGTVICVGEFEDGAFNTILEPVGTTDFVKQVGQLGYTYGGVPGNNPSARARKADGVVTEETWNGNAFVQLNAKKFRRLLCMRVDTSVGQVQFTRQAFVTGAAAFAYNMEPGQILGLDIGAGSVSSTFSATAATVTSASGTYPTTFAGGEQLVLGWDDAPNITVTFFAADQSMAQVISRINTVAGFSFAASVSSDTFSLTGIRRGAGGQVRVVSGTTGVLAALGLTAATTIGTGNVNDIDAVSFSEIKKVVEAAMTNGVVVEQDSSGRLRISKVYAASTDYIEVTAATTAMALGFTAYTEGSNDGITNLLSGAAVTLTATGTVTFGIDDETNFSVALATSDTLANVATKINAAAGFTFVAVTGSKYLFRAKDNGGQIRVVASTSSQVLTDMGLSLQTVTNPGVASGTIPAGTVVQNSAGDRVFVTMQAVNVSALAIAGVTASGSGPYTVKVRHATDDGTGLSAAPGTVTSVPNAPDLGSFACTNLLTCTAALTEGQIDAQYATAIDATLDLNTAAREANVIFSARQSHAVRRKLRENAVSASARGMFGRMAVIRSPLGVTKATAMSRIAEPGVGAYRDQRVVYCWPQANSFVPLIARRGIAAGKGFTADGNVDIGADGFLASILSQLPPEENPGQLTSFTDGVNGVESSPNAQGLEMEDYTQLKAAGICALRMDDGSAIFQSGVTSVDPAVYPNLKNIARRRMADFIQDSLARRTKSYGKKLSTFLRRKAIVSEIRTFLNGLQSKNNPAFQRIDSFSVNDKDGNTPETLGQGLFRVIIKVRTLSSLDSIVLETTIGEQVQIDEVPQAIAA